MHLSQPVVVFSCLPSVRDRVRTKMERDILVEVNHPFIVKLHYGWFRFLFFAYTSFPCLRARLLLFCINFGGSPLGSSNSGKKRNVNTYLYKSFGFRPLVRTFWIFTFRFCRDFVLFIDLNQTTVVDILAVSLFDKGEIEEHYFNHLPWLRFSYVKKWGIIQ